MHNPFDLLIDSYLADKVGIDAHFLSAALCLGLQQHIVELQAAGLLKMAGIGNHAIKDVAQTMRGDSIYWLDKSHPNTFEQQFLLQAEAFIERLNSTCYAGITGYEFHYAVYAPGSGYQRHKDQFKNNTSRQFSLIHYLNPNWLASDGGALLVYPTATAQTILPHAQTAVFFKSDELEHEVATAHRSRMSITGWLKVN
jgi:SM-20-related protein